MIQLTDHQVEVLHDLANHKKCFAAYASTKDDGVDAAKTIDNLFAQQMQLVENGLLLDITSRPNWKVISDKYKDEEGRTLRVLTATETTKLMFKRQRRKSVN